MLPDPLSFRPVRPADKERVIAFTLNTWGDDEDDYIKDVFDEWVADPHGPFTAAVLDGQVVGIAKLTDRGDDEWWLEGLRIDPAYRRQGIAREFNRHHLEQVKRLGGRVVRYMTGGENAGSQAIGARAGFQHIITYRAYLAGVSDEFPLPAALSDDDVPRLAQWIDSPLMRYLHGVYRDGWSARTLTEAELQRVVAAKLVYGLKDARSNLTAWALLRSEEFDDDSEDSEPHRLRVDHLDGEPSAITELAGQMRAFAAVRRRSIVSAGVGDYPPVLAALQAAGYALDERHPGLWVLELKLADAA